ncbi:hypothetical protein Bca101_017089 [Brassica carinata]
MHGSSYSHPSSSDTATRCPLRDRTDRGHFAMKDQDIPTEGVNVSVMTKEEATIESLKLKMVSYKDTTKYR